MARSNCTTDGSKCTGIKQINNQVGKIELLINFIFLLSDFEIQQRGSRHLPGHLVCQVCSQFVKGVGGRIFNNSNRQQRRFLTGSNPSGGKANKLGTYLILAFYKHTGWLSIGLISLSWLTPFQSHPDSQSSSNRCLSSGIDLLWGNLLAGRLPCSRLSSSSTRLLPGLLLPAHTCSSFLELFHSQCNGRIIKNEKLAEGLLVAQGSRYCLDHSDNAPTTTSDSHKEEDERSFFSSWFY